MPKPSQPPGKGKGKAPTSVSLSNTSVTEETSGAVVGILSATDPNKGDTITYTVDDPRFEVFLNQLGQWALRLAPGESLNYEVAPTVTIEIIATDSTGLTKTQPFTITVSNTNDRPTDISLSNASVDENSLADVVVGNLSATDEDVGGTFTYSLVDDAFGRFKIVGDQILTTGTGLDAEDATSHDVTVRVTDSGGSSYDEILTITINDLPEYPNVQRASVATDGTNANGSSSAPVVSGDGRYVAFVSDASNLVNGDTNGAYEIFLYDRLALTTERVSVAASGAQANSASYQPSISADGRFITYTSWASNLVSGDTIGVTDIFIRDRLNQTTERISRSNDLGLGGQANGDSRESSISADGRYVTYVSVATNLVTQDNNFAQDVFVYDRSSNTTERVSIASDGSEGNWTLNSYQPSISGDGRYVTFTSHARNFVADDTNNTSDVFIHDRLTHTTERVSVASDGTQANNGSYSSSISADGRYVAFISDANNLVADDTATFSDVFVYDRLTRTTERVSVATDGTQGNARSYSPSISADGRYVTFVSRADTLVADDTNAFDDVFVHDRLTHTTRRVSIALDGTQGNNAAIGNEDGYGTSISGDGGYIAYASHATVLAGTDTNSAADIFVVRNDEWLISI